MSWTPPFRRRSNKKTRSSCRNVDVRTNGEIQTVDITVQAIAEPSALRGSVMIVFTDVATLP